MKAHVEVHVVIEKDVAVIRKYPKDFSCIEVVYDEERARLGVLTAGRGKQTYCEHIGTVIFQTEG
jgi:hypothetical protein